MNILPLLLFFQRGHVKMKLICNKNNEMEYTDGLYYHYRFWQ